MRHPVAQEIAAAARNDRQPAPRIVLELRALERIELMVMAASFRNTTSLRGDATASNYGAQLRT
jgi:hypothetical protein